MCPPAAAPTPPAACSAEIEARHTRLLERLRVAGVGVAGDADLPRAALALRAGPLGTLWAIEGDGKLSPQAERALRDGARLATLHMPRAHSALDLDRFRRGELLRALLEESAAPEPNWARLGFGPGDRVAMIALAPSWSRDAAEALLVTHVAREVGRVCHVLRPDAPVTTSSRAVYVLVAGTVAADATARLADRVVADASRTLGGRIYAAVRSEGAGPRSIPLLRDEVDQILRVTAGGAGPRVATISDVHSSVLLAHLGDELERHPELRHPALAELIEQDERVGATSGWRSGSSFASTIRCPERSASRCARPESDGRVAADDGSRQDPASCSGNGAMLARPDGRRWDS